MGNEHRRRCTNGDEVMVHTAERHAIVVHRGEVKAAKTGTNRRERREEKTMLRGEGDRER